MLQYTALTLEHSSDIVLFLKLRFEIELACSQSSFKRPRTLLQITQSQLTVGGGNYQRIIKWLQLGDYFLQDIIMNDDDGGL